MSQIAETDLPTITDALSDAKLAKRVHTSAQSTIDAPEGSNKRKSEPSTSPAAKRSRVGSAYELPSAPSSHAELEASLDLPECDEGEDVIRSTVLWTNRAPLVLAFAVKVLEYTMPEQPLSSRLSLAQAVVSANSRTKAGSLGIEKGKGAEEEGWGVGQPKVRVMGREVVVLKRGDYVVGDEDEAAGECVSLASYCIQWDKIVRIPFCFTTVQWDKVRLNHPTPHPPHFLSLFWTSTQYIQNNWECSK